MALISREDLGNCKTCYGDGNCITCRGTGEGPGDDGCTRCEGTGACPKCNGSGDEEVPAETEEYREFMARELGD